MSQDQPSLQSQIPESILNKIKDKPVVETSFATGPGFCVGKVDKHDPAITFEQGLAWMERFRGDLKGGCIIFEDESRLWFSWYKFDRYEAKPKTPRPEPGIEMADMTEPKFLKLCGLRRKGNKIVGATGGMVFGEYTDKQMAQIHLRKPLKGK